MATSFKITINDPCAQQWAGMQDHKNGKFCTSCQKSVVDFTQFSDVELKNWFAKDQGKSCGRFRPAQLNRVIAAKSNFSIGGFKPGLVAASLIALLSFPKPTHAIHIKSYPIAQGYSNKSFKGIVHERPETGLVTIRGTVIDKDEKTPIIGASIKVKGLSIGAITDKEGKFEIVLDRNKFKKNIVLDLRYIGYESQDVKVNLSEKDTILIRLKAGRYILGGLGIIKQPTFFEKISQFLNG
ncbi:carboxypeptidase-like regulatory domain-containing protein [Pedobacter rhodius]|uniref:Carboxypeptidase-like regulatory domain-containing protein n=1 Tax=Pedobacter rhodius TaxID=3004098 RepID=A0ABT4KXB1_9SPHI|nr:carboxypeptidase-like regulatory domain-containing protein [Pedobacter sp. SJ11]MCZ4223567.1 carboxypeptidase-like regulatory domain-containing protein [Pedobacter sp. SJ11]